VFCFGLDGLIHPSGEQGPIAELDDFRGADTLANVNDMKNVNDVDNVNDE